MTTSKDLKLFRKIIEEHAENLRSSYREYTHPNKKRGPISDSAPMSVHREYNEMLEALRRLDELIADKKAGAK